MTQADQIRQFVRSRIVDPARNKGDKIVRVRAGDVHSAMGLINRMPAVCGALDADAFLTQGQVTLVSRSGPKQGANAEWVFGL